MRSIDIQQDRSLAESLRCSHLVTQLESCVFQKRRMKCQFAHRNERLEWLSRCLRQIMGRRHRTGSMHKPVAGYTPPQSDGLQNPDCDSNYHNYIQDGLMLPAIGMKLLISHNATPTTISAITILIKGISYALGA